MSEFSKLDMVSKKNNSESIKILESIFPNVFFEGKIDFDKLKETYENQVIGRYIRALEQNKDRKKEELIKKALYYGVDALCKSMR